MEQTQHIAEKLRDFIQAHPGYFQLNAHFARIALQPADTCPVQKITFGRYDSVRHNSYPFYRPFSKIINIKAIE